MTTITPSGITTGYTTTISGVLYDLGDLFAAPTTGTPATTNYQNSGIDLSTKFAQYPTPLTVAPFITGYNINGIDISRICVLYPLTNVLNGTTITTSISGTTYNINVPNEGGNITTFNFKLISPTVSGTLYGGQAGGGGGTSIPSTTFNTNPTTNTTVSMFIGSGGGGYKAGYTTGTSPFQIHFPALNASPGQATTITFNSAATPSYSTGTSSVINSSGTANGTSGHATLIFTPF